MEVIGFLQTGIDALSVPDESKEPNYPPEEKGQEPDPEEAPAKKKKPSTRKKKLTTQKGPFDDDSGIEPTNK